MTAVINHKTGGVFAIAPTPFLPDGTLDRGSIAQMVDFYRAAKVDGLTILGLLGEAPKLEPEESVTMVREVLAAAKGMPVVVGVSAPGFAAMKRLAAESMALGTAGVMVTPPAAMRTDDQIAGYFRQAVAQVGADVPMVLQDHPTVTGVVMSPAVIRRIVEENPSIVMLKHEDWPGLEKISTLRDWQARGDMRPISILCGNGGLFLDCEMGRGADGAMTGYAFPEMLVRLVALSPSQREAAQDIFDAHLPLLRYEHQSGIGLAVRKYVLWRRGAIAHPTLRVPAPMFSDRTRSEVEFLLGRLGVRDPMCAVPPVA
ncbi:dihydrodipicolinate synthase family protein [Mesorhizobium sp. CN5-321]|jgi:4-hydroxy-tetrahydrodipicolinate synthase|uniref:dihydrodipicolinate synthase family protein n=1 Tax=Mesorhizobium hunchu TaxID=3157708 RepID=UPI0032B88078